MIEIKLPAVLFMDMKRKFYHFELSQDANDHRVHYVYTATGPTVPLVTIGIIKFVEEK